MERQEVINLISTTLKGTEAELMYKENEADANLVTNIGLCQYRANHIEESPVFKKAPNQAMAIYHFLEVDALKQLEDYLKREECYIEFNPAPEPGKNINAYLFRFGRHDNTVEQYMTNTLNCKCKILKFHSVHPDVPNLATYYCLIENSK